LFTFLCCLLYSRKFETIMTIFDKTTQNSLDDFRLVTI